MTAAVRYRKRDMLDFFIERHIRRSTSEPSTMIAAEAPAALVDRISLRPLVALSLPRQVRPGQLEWSLFPGPTA
jgi:hypothetical protein